MSLAIEIPPRTSDLVAAGAVALPIAVTTSGWLAGAENGLHVLICEPGIGATAHLLLPRDAYVLTMQPPLPLVAAGVAVCGSELVVSGSDANGGAVIMGVSAADEPAWRAALEGPPPIRWPVPFALPEPAVVWQAEANRLEIASVEGGVWGARHSLPVGGPPLAFAADQSTLWAAWPEGGAISTIKASRVGTSSHRIAGGAADAVAAGAAEQQAWVAWTAGSRTFLAGLGQGSEPVEIDLGRAAGGALAIVAGQFPVVWAQQPMLGEAGDRTYVSALARPGKPPILFEGFLHAVAWWGDRLVVLGATELWVLVRSG